MTKLLYIGLDVHKESIVVATAPEGDTAAEIHGKIGGTLEALDKLIKKLARPELELRFVYEAGPCGFVLARQLIGWGVECYVIRPMKLDVLGKGVNTDKTDAAELVSRLDR